MLGAPSGADGWVYGSQSGTESLMSIPTMPLNGLLTTVLRVGVAGASRRSNPATSPTTGDARCTSAGVQWRHDHGIRDLERPRAHRAPAAGARRARRASEQGGAPRPREDRPGRGPAVVACRMGAARRAARPGRRARGAGADPRSRAGADPPRAHAGLGVHLL